MNSEANNFLKVNPQVSLDNSNSETFSISDNLTEPVIKKEKTMAEVISLMDNYAPIIPDSVTDYYLQKAGFECNDVRIKRLLALATQKYLADIATDAFQYSKVRQSGNRKTGKDRKTILTVEDLTSALTEYGVNIKKPEYHS